jgi:hypothetical protein
MNCKNCGEIVSGKYCSHCGQNANVGTVTMASLMQEVSGSIFKLNKGFLNTFIGLFRRPGESIKEYLTGKRKSHVKPITYVLTLSTTYFLVSQITGQNTLMDEIIVGFAQGAHDSGEGVEIPAALLWFAKNYAYTTLLLLPVFSLASYLFFRKGGRNYLEHIVLNSYISGQQAVLYACFMLLNVVVKAKILEVIPVFVSIFYAVWVLGRFFPEGNRVMHILRSLLTYLLYLIVSVGLLVAVMGISELLS